MDIHRSNTVRVVVSLTMVALFEAAMVVERDTTVLAVAFGAALALGLIWRSCIIVMAIPVLAIVMLVLHLALVGDVASPASDPYLDWLTYPVFGTVLFLVTALGATFGAAAIPVTSFVHDHWDGPLLTVCEGIHERATHCRFVNHVQNIDQADFETLVLKVLSNIGFELVDAGSDSGAIVHGTLSGVRGWPNRTVVHLNWSKADVPASTVQEIRCRLAPGECGLIITNRDFTREARTLASRTPTSALVFINGERLVELMIAHGIGISEARHEMITGSA